MSSAEETPNSPRARNPKTVARQIGIVAGQFFLIAVLGEVVMRTLTLFVDIYDIEMVRYARELKMPSPIPGLSHQHRGDAAAHLMGVDVTLNGLGHRNPELASPKPANEFRIHVIGGSIAMGWGVREEKTFTALLERRLNDGGSGERRFWVINAGVGNYNLRYAVELLKRQIDVTRPDLVVIQYYINDAEENPARRDNVLVKYSYFFAMLYVRLKSTLQLMADDLTEYYGELYRDGNPAWDDAVSALGELRELTRRRDIGLVALLVPEVHDLSADGPYPPIYLEIGETFNAMDIPLVSAYEPFRQRFGNDPSGAWIAWDDPHPSAKGHEVMAEVLYQKITDILNADGERRR